MNQRVNLIADGVVQTIIDMEFEALSDHLTSYQLRPVIMGALLRALDTREKAGPDGRRAPDWQPACRDLFINTSGFLTLIADGLIPSTDAAKREAQELLNKIGDCLTR